MDGKQLILIIEDDKSLAAGLCRALQSEEIEAVSCGTLKAAANLLYRQQESGRSFALALLDVNLPDGSGFDFLKEIKKKYGASTTWMGKLLPRIYARRHGGCPLLVVGITPETVLDWKGE